MTARSDHGAPQRPPEVPQGGAPAGRSAFYPWAVWTLSALFFFYAFFQRVAPSVMVGDLMRDFAVSGAILGNLAAFYFYAYAGLQLPVGLMLDRWGPRRVLTITALICGVGSLLFATADSLWQANLGRLLIGGGAAFGFVGNLKIAAAWFPPKRFAMMSGLTMMVGMAGGIAGQAPLAALIAAFGWRDTMTWAAVFVLLLGPLFWLVIRDDADPGGSLPHEPAPNPLRGLGHTLATPQILVVGLFGTSMVATVLSFGGLWAVPYLMEVYKLSGPAAAASASLMLVGFGVGAPLSGWVSDHVGRRRLPMLVSAFGAFGSFATMIYLPGLPLIAVQALLLVNGVASGAAVIGFAVARENVVAARSGGALAFANMAMVASGALFQPLIGWLLDRHWDGRTVDGVRLYAAETFRTAFLSLTVCGVVAVIAALALQETYCRPRVDED